MHFVLDFYVSNPCLVRIAGQDPESFPRTLILACTTTLDSLLQEPEDLEIEQNRNVDYYGRSLEWIDKRKFLFQRMTKTSWRRMEAEVSQNHLLLRYALKSVFLGDS
jgi:hypothetical protein